MRETERTGFLMRMVSGTDITFIPMKTVKLSNLIRVFMLLRDIAAIISVTAKTLRG